MGTQEIAAAVQRVRALLERRPQFAVHDDEPAQATWQGGVRVVSSHADGTRFITDLPGELGGDGSAATPGWLFRAGLASCLATRIALQAAVTGVELEALEVRATSRSDLRGLLGVPDSSGEPVDAAPTDACLTVRISAVHASRERLNDLIEESYRCSPTLSALRNAVPVELCIERDGG